LKVAETFGGWNQELKESSNCVCVCEINLVKTYMKIDETKILFRKLYFAGNVVWLEDFIFSINRDIVIKKHLVFSDQASFPTIICFHSSSTHQRTIHFSHRFGFHLLSL
jgi:hypothetical protein